MTIASELSTLQTNLRNSYDAISSKGGTLPEYQNFDNLSSAIESISGGGSGGGNVYSLAMAIEAVHDLAYSSTIKAGETAIDILGENDTYKQLPNTWQYAPATQAERFQLILTNDLLVTEEKLNSILGETNE